MNNLSQSSVTPVLDDRRVAAPVKVVAWLGAACRSVMPLFRAMAARPDVQLKVIVAKKSLDEIRRILGWVPDSAGFPEYSVLSDTGWKSEVEQLMRDNPDAIHVVAGYHWVERLSYALSLALKRGYRVSILSEAPLNMSSGWRYWAKQLYLRYRLPVIARPVASHAERIFNMSGRQHQPLLDATWSGTQIIPYGYFPADRGIRSRPDRSGDALDIICIGLLKRYKGVDVLVRALAMLRDRGVDFHCHITGEGSDKARLLKMHSDLDLGDRVTFPGIVDDAALRRLFERADVMVCPGHAEPWGIRINEGIQAGLAQVVSDRLGAAELITTSGSGFVFRSGDAGELCQCLYDLDRTPSLIQRMKRAANAYRPWIEPAQAASYMLEVLTASNSQTARPIAPWHSVEARTAACRAFSE